MPQPANSGLVVYIAKHREYLELRRWDVIDRLRSAFAYQSIVQLVTPTTSFDMQGREELSRFSSSVTLYYASPEQREGIAGVDRLPDRDELVRHVRKFGIRGDLVFVDPWHTYHDSMTLMLLALEIVRPGGHVVIHDCHPESVDVIGMVSPGIDLPWCGRTWEAFVDLTSRMGKAWAWETIRSDHGIGVIHVPENFHSLVRLLTSRGIADSARRVVPENLDDEQSFELLKAIGEERLRLVSPDQWIGSVRSKPNMVVDTPAL